MALEETMKRFRNLARHATLRFSQDGSFEAALADIGGHPGPSLHLSGSVYETTFEQFLEHVVTKAEELKQGST